MLRDVIAVKRVVCALDAGRDGFARSARFGSCWGQNPRGDRIATHLISIPMAPRSANSDQHGQNMSCCCPPPRNNMHRPIQD